MPSPVADPQVEAAFAALDAALDELVAMGLEPRDTIDTYAHIRRIEGVSRRVSALQTGLITEIESRGLHRADGHASAKVMVRFGANLSNAEALRRSKAARALRTMPLVAAGHAAGRIGRCQVDRIAALHANPRVAVSLQAQDANVAVIAAQLRYAELDDKLTEWEQLEDQDGAQDRAERNHARRNYAVYRNADGSWRTEGGCGSIQGARMDAIHRRFTQREWEADWAEARERLGDAATKDDLRRTQQQRQADAADAAWALADQAHATTAGTAVTTLNIELDLHSAERAAQQMCGQDPGPDPRADSLLADLASDLDPEVDRDLVTAPGDRTKHAPAPAPGRKLTPYRSQTRNGHPVHPTEALAAGLVGHIRRVVLGTDRVVLDMGRKHRLFTGPRKEAVLTTQCACAWPGCEVPASDCQADHMRSYNGPTEGRTNPDNGAPLCGRHNRTKEHGFTISRDQRGRMHVYRPDGTEIT